MMHPRTIRPAGDFNGYSVCRWNDCYTPGAMCLVLVGYHAHPNYPLVVAANRDEFYDRPTTPAAFWNDMPHVLAGRDEKAGGTWMGITKQGEWAAITNYRDPSARHDDAPSRGHLVADYLTEASPAGDYLHDVASRGEQYNGFNILVGTPDELMYYSNRGGAIRALPHGVHGLSNHLLNTEWPKVERGKKKLQRLLQQESELDAERLLEALHDTETPEDERLPDTGVGLAGERLLSPMFIEGDNYGTRSSTVLLVDASHHVTFVERTFENGMSTMTQQYDFDIAAVDMDEAV
jgi:uncharacterized protein with NRDE domain